MKERPSLGPSAKDSELTQPSQMVGSVLSGDGSGCDGHSGAFQHSRDLNTTGVPMSCRMMHSYSELSSLRQTPVHTSIKAGLRYYATGMPEAKRGSDALPTLIISHSVTFLLDGEWREGGWKNGFVRKGGPPANHFEHFSPWKTQYESQFERSWPVSAVWGPGVGSASRQ